MATRVYKDDRGRKVVDVDGYDALMKSSAFGLPTSPECSRPPRCSRTAQHRLRKGEIAAKWAPGISEGKPEVARGELAAWNERNLESLITIRPQDIMRRV
jgi:hypothetical protein